jgi:hypothetical protein
VPVVVDMGALEFQAGVAVQPAFGDLDGDLSVGASDFLDLIGAWGDCSEDCCLADLDLDRAVGTSDLLLLLASWG